MYDLGPGCVAGMSLPVAAMSSYERWPLEGSLDFMALPAKQQSRMIRVSAHAPSSGCSALVQFAFGGNVPSVELDSAVAVLKWSACKERSQIDGNEALP